MSIRPVSDFVLEVAQAADPARLSAAITKLNMPGGEAAFADAMRSAGSRAAGPAGSVDSRLTGLKWPGADAGRDAALSPAQKLESLMLQSYVKTMLPAGKAMYGKGAAADIHRSMMAEQIAGQITRSGGLGIAARIGAGMGVAA